jgi:hypothetical protein
VSILTQSLKVDMMLDICRTHFYIFLISHAHVVDIWGEIMSDSSQPHVEKNKTVFRRNLCFYYHFEYKITF